MKRLILIAILIATLLAVSSFNVALAKPVNPPSNDIAKVVFVHYKTPVKPDWAGNNGAKPNSGYQLYKNVKWADSSLPVSYLINTGSVPAGVDPAAAAGEIQAAFGMWDSNTAKPLNNYAGTTTVAGAIPDGLNTVAWVPISNSNTIAVTTFWYNIITKRLIQFDMELNSNFAWGIDPDSEGTTSILTGAMDIRNIVTHEAGHTLVLDDLYDSQNKDMTMYGYSGYGEVKKISLEWGDLNGLHKLYGN